MEKDQQKSAPITPVTFDEFKVPTYEEWKQAAEAALKGPVGALGAAGSLGYRS